MLTNSTCVQIVFDYNLIVKYNLLSFEVKMDPVNGDRKRQGGNNSKSGGEKPSRLKVPMTRLAVSENKQTLIKETIERITGKVKIR